MYGIQFDTLFHQAVTSGTPLSQPLVHQLWQGASSPEPLARDFCRTALVQLKTQANADAVTEAFALLESLSWERLQLGQASPGSAPSVVCALELLAARVDTALWLTLPDGGVKLLGLEGARKVAVALRADELALRASEEPSVVIPWRGPSIHKQAVGVKVSESPR